MEPSCVTETYVKDGIVYSFTSYLDETIWTKTLYRKDNGTMYQLYQPFPLCLDSRELPYIYYRKKGMEKPTCIGRFGSEDMQSVTPETIMEQIWCYFD